MAEHSGLGIDLPFSASGDLNDYIYHFVKCASTSMRVDVATGACHPVVIGVLQNDPMSEDAAVVRIAGITPIECDAGGAITYGNLLTSASNGKAVVSTGSHFMGIALEDDSSGCARISMLLRPTSTIVVGTY